jgi:heme a synthase
VIRRFAATIAALTVVLIAAGGLVTNTESGLACPDWPTCYGSLLPQMTGNVAVEHTHRLIAAAVGPLTALLAVLVLRRAKQGLLAIPLGALCTLILGAAFWAAYLKHQSGDLPAAGVVLVALGYAGIAGVVAQVRETDGKLAIAALGVVGFQALLGGVTVLYRLPTLVLVMHLGTSMLFLSLMTVVALRVEGAAKMIAPRGLLWLTAAGVYLQIILGATVRHTGAGLVCTDLPFCRGALWPTDVHPMVHLHMAHRAFAFVVLALVAVSSWRIARTATGAVRALAIAAPVLVLVQITLGIATILTFKDLVPLTAHLLVGALLLCCEVSLLALTSASETAPSLSFSTGRLA